MRKAAATAADGKDAGWPGEAGPLPAGIEIVTSTFLARHRTTVTREPAEVPETRR